MSGLTTRAAPGALAAVARAITRERPPQAILFVGPARVGKTSLALELAAGLLCLVAAPVERPCGQCAACRKVAHGNHPDLHRLAPEGAGDQIRLPRIQELVSALALLPLEGRFRVALVEQAHRLNQDAQNALLKTLEEPPPRTCLILTVDDESLILPTVRSRCARVVLGPSSSEVLVDLLVERGLADPPRAAALARAAEGRPGIVLALAAQPEALVAEGRLVRTLLDLLRADRRRRLLAVPQLLADAAILAAALAGEPAATTSEIGDTPGGSEAPLDAQPPGPPGRKIPSPAERRAGTVQLLSTWRALTRDLAVVAHGGAREVRSIDLLEELRAAAEGLDRAALGAFLQRLDVLAAAVEAYANPELVLDVLLLAWPRGGSVRSAA